MGFQSFKRRDLQALCKLNNIPANLTNAAMAEALESLPAVKGIEDLLEQSETGALQSSQKYVPNSPYVARTSTCQKPSKEGLECSTLTTRTRCGARRVPKDGTDTRKTTTLTRTTRRRERQEASIQLDMEKDMQANFEKDLEQSDVTEESGVESTESSEKVSDVSVDQRGHIMSGSQEQPENNDGEVVDVCDDKQNLGKDHVVNEAQEESIEISNSLQKLDFHSLGRKDLQNLCKRNKIPANMTNAAMADTLGSLDTVEGLEEFLEGYDPLAIKSPQTSRMTSSRVCQAPTAQKTTGRKSARAGSALFKSVARKKEDLNVENQESLLSMNANEGGLSVEMNLEKSEVVDYAPENSSTINSATKYVSEELASDNQTAIVLSEEFSNLLKNEVELQDDALEKVSDDQEAKVNISSESNMVDLTMTDNDRSSEPSVDKCSMLDAPEAVFNGLNGKNANTRTLKSEFDTNFSYAPHCECLMQDAPTVTIKEFAQLRELSDLEADNEDIEGLLDTETSKLHLEFANEVVSTEEALHVSEGINSILHIEVVDLKPEANCGIEDEHVESGFASEIPDDVEVLCPISDPEVVSTEEDSYVFEGINSILHVDVVLKPEANCGIEDEHVESGFASKISDDVATLCPISDPEVVSTEDDSYVSEGINSILHIDVDLKPEANCGIEDAHMESGFASEISDDIATLCPNSEPEDDNAEHRLSVRFVSEVDTQDVQPVVKGKATPLCQKSLRKLKKLVKEKLHETNLLAKKMENLTLQDNEITVDVAKKVEEDLREVCEETPDELNSSTVSVLSDTVEETNEGVEWKAKDVVKSILTVSKIFEEPIEPSCFPVTAINAPKPLVFTTPIKSSSKTPISIRVLDANKENIHDSATKISLTPVMSMGKLKKEVKVLLVQSEKKRPALQSRSDNQCSLTSP